MAEAPQFGHVGWSPDFRSQPPEPGEFLNRALREHHSFAELPPIEITRIPDETPLELFKRWLRAAGQSFTEEATPDGFVRLTVAASDLPCPAPVARLIFRGDGSLFSVLGA